MDVYLVSHNGIGDNLYMIGAIHFIKQFYKNVYFLCRNRSCDIIKPFFIENPNIICVSFNGDDEFNDIKKIIIDKYENNDVIICGFVHKSYLKSKITNHEFLNYKAIDKKYTIDYDTLTTENYSFIEDFYKDMNLNLTYFYEYFYLPSNELSKKLFDDVSKYYLIFIQNKCSYGISLNISKLIEKYTNYDNVLLLCTDENLYKKEDGKIEKYNLAQKFVLNGIICCVDTIKNSNEIYIIDSCFTGIVLPLLKLNKLKAKKVRIIKREEVDKHIF